LEQSVVHVHADSNVGGASSHTECVQIQGMVTPICAQYLELQPGSQYGHWVTEVFALRSQGHEGFSEQSQTKF